MAEKQSFETAVKKLEKIVKQMESGDLNLEEALTKYEEGMKTANRCMDLLNKTEKKIEMLTLDKD